MQSYRGTWLIKTWDLISYTLHYILFNFVRLCIIDSILFPFLLNVNKSIRHTVFPSHAHSRYSWIEYFFTCRGTHWHLVKRGFALGGVRSTHWCTRVLWKILELSSSITSEANHVLHIFFTFATENSWNNFLMIDAFFLAYFFKFTSNYVFVSFLKLTPIPSSYLTNVFNFTFYFSLISSRIHRNFQSPILITQ